MITLHHCWPAFQAALADSKLTGHAAARSSR
jgi:hypothetical protein